jgi:hypothetical protein
MTLRRMDNVGIVVDDLAAVSRPTKTSRITVP